MRFGDILGRAERSELNQMGTCQSSNPAFQCSMTPNSQILPSYTLGIWVASVAHIWFGAWVMMCRSCGVSARVRWTVGRVAARAGKAAAPRKIEMNIEAAPLRVEFRERNRPGRRQSQRQLQQVGVSHGGISAGAPT